MASIAFLEPYQHSANSPLAGDHQAELVRAVLDSGAAVTIVALRTPYDLGAFPGAALYLCTYSILESSMQALAEALCGEILPQGRLPVSIPGLHERGHRF